MVLWLFCSCICFFLNYYAKNNDTDLLSSYFFQEENEKADTLIVDSKEGKDRADIGSFPARFVYGIDSLESIIESKLIIPHDFKISKQKGIVAVLLIVDGMGEIVNVSIQRSLTSSTNDEVLRVMKSLPDFIPAQRDDKRVLSGVILNVTFDAEKNYKKVDIMPLIPRAEMDSSMGGVDFFAEFPGGNDSLKRFIDTNLIVPEDFKSTKQTGKVAITLKIDATGKVLYGLLGKGLTPSTNEEALRIAKILPNFIPAQRDGKGALSGISLLLTFDGQKREGERTE